MRAARLPLLPALAAGLKLRGELDTLAPWAFVDRFCFVPTPEADADLASDAKKKKYGFVEFEVTYPTGAAPALLFYYDGFDKWVDGVDGGGSCSERLRAADNVVALQSPTSFVTSVAPDSLGRTTTAKGRAYVRNEAYTWFFVALANCAAQCPEAAGYRDCQGPLVASYKLHFTNGAAEERREFSADELGTLEVAWCALAAYAALGAWALRVRAALRRRRKFHHTVAMLCWSAWVQAAGCAFALCHVATFARDGAGVPWCLAAARFLGHAADILLVSLLVLLAKGWTLVRRKLSANGRVRVTVYATVLLWATVALELWRLHAWDRSRYADAGESPPGYALVALRAYAAAWFLYAAHTTRRNYPRKARFYGKFNPAAALWLVSRPALALIGRSVNDHERAIVLYACDQALVVVAHGLLLFLYDPAWPAWNGGFPFHAASAADLGLASRAADEDDYALARDEDAGVDVDTGAPLRRSAAETYTVSRSSVFRRISVQGGRTARLMRAMARISADLDRALLDLQGEIECDVDT